MPIVIGEDAKLAKPRTTVLLFLVVVGCTCLAFLYLTRERLTEIEAGRNRFESTVTNKLSAIDWPCWRGPNGSGFVPGDPPVTTWSADSNVAWKCSIPGTGYSSPVIAGDTIFLTTADESEGTQSLLAISRNSGHVVWNKVVNEGELPEKHENNSHASATPVCDEQAVYIVFAIDNSLKAAAYSHDGERLWLNSAGPYESQWGYGSSPVLYRGMLLIAGDSRGSNIGRFIDTSFIAALDCKDGSFVWRTKRANQRSYGTPVVAKLCGRDQLVLNGAGAVCSFDPLTGQQIWACDSVASRTANTVTFDDRCVYSTATRGGKEILCISADGDGDVSKSRLKWSETSGASDVPSPLVVGKYLYTVTDNGVLVCFNAETGKNIYKQRLEGDFFASPVCVGEHIFITSKNGVTFVFKVGDEYVEVARNRIDEGSNTSPVFHRDQVILRGLKHLWCFEAPKLVP